MANQIDRDAFVKRDVLKNPIPYTRGTDLLPIVIHFRDFQIPSGATARVFVAKPDGNAVYTTATIDGNDVTVDVTDQMFIELGTALMQISIMDGEEELVSFVQPVDVQQNLKAGDLPASTTDVKFLDEAIEQANEAVNTATTAAQQAATAVQNANQAIEDANDAISDLNAQIASLNTNFASLANNVSISQLDTTAKTLVGGINELNSKWLPGTSVNNIDYNNLTAGLHYCGANCTNAPENYCRVLCIYSFEANRNDGIQIAFAVLSSKIYRRKYSNSAGWTEWTTFSDDATLSQISAYSASKPESTEELTIGETYNVVVRKHGRIVSIQFDISGTLSVDNRSILLFTLDEGYRPISTVLHNYITQGRNTMLLSIYNSGTVNIATFDKAPITGFILRQTITYIAADE